jgi:8-oxo-dGTP pyrophosphatase MutT (NUDIX family)
VEREVFEETGIRAHFRGILAFTYKRDFRFGHGDVHIGCLMSLNDDEEEQKIAFDPLEIATCKWMSLDKWANTPEMHPVPFTLHFARMAIAVLDGREQLLESDRIQVESQDPNKPPWEKMMYRKKLNHEK